MEEEWAGLRASSTSLAVAHSLARFLKEREGRSPSSRDLEQGEGGGEGGREGEREGGRGKGREGKGGREGGKGGRSSINTPGCEG